MQSPSFHDVAGDSIKRETKTEEVGKRSPQEFSEAAAKQIIQSRVVRMKIGMVQEMIEGDKGVAGITQNIHYGRRRKKLSEHSGIHVRFHEAAVCPKASNSVPLVAPVVPKCSLLQASAGPYRQIVESLGDVEISVKQVKGQMRSRTLVGYDVDNIAPREQPEGDPTEDRHKYMCCYLTPRSEEATQRQEQVLQFSSCVGRAQQQPVTRVRILSRKQHTKLRYHWRFGIMFARQQILRR